MIDRSNYPTTTPEAMNDTLDLHDAMRGKIRELVVLHRKPCRRISRSKCTCGLVMAYRPEHDGEVTIQ